VMIAAMHCGLIPFAILDIGEPAAEIDFDCVVGAAPPQHPGLAPDLLIDDAVLAGRLSDPSLRTFPDQPDEAILFVGSTTGTTGRRKLVAETCGVSRRKEIAADGSAAPAGETPSSWMQLKPGDRILSTFGDLTYVGVTVALQCLSAGATYVRMSRDRAECVRLINACQVNWIRGTTGVLSEIMDAMDGQGVVCPSVKRIRLVGSLFDRKLIERIENHFSAEISVGYASTELGRISKGVVTSSDFQLGYVGALYPEVTLVTAGTRQRPAPLVMAHNPETYRPYYSNGEVVPFTGGLYTLPDLGFMEHGRLYLVGRDDEVVNVDGVKAAFADIEAAVRAQPGIRDAAVVSATPISDIGGLLIGVVAVDAIDVPSLANVVANAARTQRIVERTHIFQMAAVPRNASGKTDREEMVAAYRRLAASHGDR
jgi:acyl-coenzyme A synthetase/AMP-(fatty) acid ligase